jgi:hypothetical protein
MKNIIFILFLLIFSCSCSSNYSDRKSFTLKDLKEKGIDSSQLVYLKFRIDICTKEKWNYIIYDCPGCLADYIVVCKGELNE